MHSALVSGSGPLGDFSALTSIFQDGCDAADEAPRPHKLAVIIPYRGRPAQLEQMLPVTRWCVSRSGLDHQIFLMEQSDQSRFNRGALLNIGVLLLEGSDYDFFAFHDVDVMCGSHVRAHSASGSLHVP